MRLLLLAVTVCLSPVVNAQKLYTPRDIQQAYKNGTRSLDGKPGKNYWQNKASYKINITAAPPDRTIRGNESIVYYNNSTDTLKSVTVKLFLNIHKPGAPREFGVVEDYITSGTHIDAVSVNGEKVEWKQNPRLFTWQVLRLKTPLAPKQSIQFDFDWHYEISKQSNREGMIDSTSYFLAYFYPRIAVYDDYNGWDRMDFVDSKEFYSDFNDYDVTINVPKNYIVWGTGTLQNPEKLLKREYLKRFTQSLTSDETIRIATKQDIVNKKVTTQNEVNSWEFKATNIPDMAFGLSDHYVWDGCSVVVDDATKRRASAQAAYKDEAKDYHSVAQFARHSLQWLSHNWPGIPYPYEKTTIFQGFADMEYPMMANNSSFKDTVFSRFVAEHEIAHTYMPFYMGINETRYGFMDEGWATTFEILVGAADLGQEKAEQFYKQFRVEGWINDPSSAGDIPIITPADALSVAAFGNNIYGKASLGYLAIKDLLGDELFKKCLHEYMNQWNGKHPIPWDFFNSFNTTAGKNLNWFWNNWFFTSSYIDLSVKSVKNTGKQYSMVIDNKGGMAAPVNVILKYKDASSEKIHQTPAIWEKNQQQVTVNIVAKKEIESITLDGGIYMDAHPEDNSWKK
jgi:hypothetical protein